MLLAVLLAAALQPDPGALSDEDAAHRADRLRTRELNTRSANGYAGATVSPGDARAYRRAQDEYQQRLDAWKRQVAACEAGNYAACRP